MKRLDKLSQTSSTVTLILNRFIISRTVYRQERSHFHRRCAGTPTEKKSSTDSCVLWTWIAKKINYVHWNNCLWNIK